MADSNFRWKTTQGGGPVSLDALRAFVDSVVRDLDPGSRYVTELRAVLDASADVDDAMRRLRDPERTRAFQRDGGGPSRGERGRSWVDAETWKDMDPFEQLLSNLLTGETRMMWAGEGAANFAKLAEVLASQDAPRRALSVPCSTGKEPFSIAIAGLRAGLRLCVVGVDRQGAYLERARTGRLVPHDRDLELEGALAYLERGPDGHTRVAKAVLDRCSFVQGDVLTGELPPVHSFALVSCRNLLGYFRGESLEVALTNVCARVRAGGVLLVDGFVTDSAEMSRAPDLLAEWGFTRRGDGGTHYYDAPRAWGKLGGRVSPILPG